GHIVSQHNFNWSRTACAHSDVWTSLWRTFQSGGDSGRCCRTRNSLAGSPSLYCRTVLGWNCWNACRPLDVRPALVFAVHPPTAWLGPRVQRIRGNLRTVIGDLGML